MAERIGMWLALARIALLMLGGLIYGLVRLVFLDDGVPIIVRVGVAFVVAGVAVLLVVLTRQRLRDRVTEKLEGIKP